MDHAGEFVTDGDVVDYGCIASYIILTHKFHNE